MRLREWQYASGNKVSTTSGALAQNTSATSGAANKSFKKRFDKLINYYGQHLPAEVDYTLIGLLTNDKLEFAEHYNDGQVVEYKISIEPATEAWNLKYYVNEQLTDEHSDKGWPELLKVLRAGYIEVPATTTLEYKNLLTEWVAMKGSQNTSSQPATSKNPYTRGQAYRYNRLLDQITSDGIAKYKLHKITNNTLDITVDTKKTKDLNIKIVYDPVDDDYELITNGKTSLSGCDYEKDILPILIAGEVINNTDLCESAGSIADDFKLYENLWD